MTEEFRPRLVVMVKAPLVGRVKSRLARDVGPVEAARFYRVATAALLCRLGRDPRWSTVLAVTPDRMRAAPFWPAHLPRTGQGPGDLGARMQGVMEFLPPGPVVVVGSDIPGIRPEHIGKAFRRLGTADAVFGPASDGGYWLVGLKRRPRVPHIFGNVRWSTEHALADTLRNCRGLDVRFLDVLEDVDTGAEYRRWRRGEVNGRV